MMLKMSLQFTIKIIEI